MDGGFRASVCVGARVGRLLLELGCTQLFMGRAADYTRGIGARADLIRQGFDPFIESPFIGLGRCNLIAYSGFPTTHVFYLTRLFEDGLVGSP